MSYILLLDKINKSNFNQGKIEELYSILPEIIIIKDEPDFNPDIVGSCDVSYRSFAIVSYVAWSVSKRCVVEEITRKKEIPAEYIPGRFALRELPLIAEVLLEISSQIDCLILDGHGIAHSQMSGLASFAGVLFKLPTIGAAKNLLVGEYESPVLKRGEHSDIIYNLEKVGEALCTKDDTSPIFVSPGHLIGFESSRRLILELAINSKFPEPLRLADINARKSSL
ncbi:endonuclease V [candidate division WOR-3 bacterium]|nr:endonuclease V [candidate division WOR-3 bacterium]